MRFSTASFRQYGKKRQWRSLEGCEPERLLGPYRGRDGVCLIVSRGPLMLSAMRIASRAIFMCTLVALLFGGAPAMAAAPTAQEGSETAVKPPADAPAPTVVSDRERVDTEPQVLREFEPILAQHGRWFEHPRYGRVWVPSETVVGENFEPYVTAGKWALNVNGEWVWVSDYAFGGVVFHYGRWAWASDAGWMWIPGWRYAPAWVLWRVPRGRYAYVGWAPMPPSYIWVNGQTVWLDERPYAAFVFCPSHDIFVHHPHRFVVRDRVLLRRLARQTSLYRPSHRGRHVRQGPSLSLARVPARAVPKSRIAARRSQGVSSREVTPPTARLRTRQFPAPAAAPSLSSRTSRGRATRPTGAAPIRHSGPRPSAATAAASARVEERRAVRPSSTGAVARPRERATRGSSRSSSSTQTRRAATPTAKRRR